MIEVRSAADVSAAIRDAEQTLNPIGGGWVAGEGTPLRLTGLTAIRHLDADDMTVTVEAGLPWNDFRTAMAEADREVPLDVSGEGVTVGSAVAAAISGPRRRSCGTWRDWVLGIAAVDGGGRQFRSGGRVVKNVAGYDLAKLLIGSYGQFAVLTELTFRLRPTPAAGAVLERETAVEDVAAELRRIDVDCESIAFSVACLDVACSDRVPSVVVGFEGHPDDVARGRTKLVSAGYVVRDETPCSAAARLGRLDADDLRGIVPRSKVAELAESEDVVRLTLDGDCTLRGGEVTAARLAGRAWDPRSRPQFDATVTPAILDRLDARGVLSGRKP